MKDTADLWVVDNGSKDDSTDYVKVSHPDVHLLQLDANYGYAGGYNRALKHISAQKDYTYVVLLNSDVDVEEGWLEKLYLGMVSEPGIGAVQPKIRSFDKRGWFEYAGAAGGYLDKWGYPFCKGRIFDALEEDKGQYDVSSKIFWATGAAFMIRTDVFIELGGFDEEFFAHMEEIDLCWRMQHLGYTLKYIPDSVVYHVGGGTLKNGSAFKYYLNYRNNLAMITKNFYGSYWFFMILWKTGLDALSAVNFLMAGKGRVVLAILKAHGSYWSRLSFWIKNRKNTVRAVPNKALLSQISIVWQYFAKKVRSYNDLPKH